MNSTPSSAPKNEIYLMTMVERFTRCIVSWCVMWSLSGMAAGGTAIIPLPARGTHSKNLLPTRRWFDGRIPTGTIRAGCGGHIILLRQAYTLSSAQKVGAVDIPVGWRMPITPISS
jgi:hypothetical protein